MTPERIEEQVTAVVIGINYGRSEKLTEDEEDIIRLALRQCAQEAADEALDKVLQDAANIAGTIAEGLYGDGESFDACLAIESRIRALKGKP